MEYDFSRITVLDFETTGLRNPQPVSLGILHYEDGKLICKKNILINPEAEIEYSAFQVHGISQEDVEDQPNFKDYWGQLKPYLDNTNILIAHNSPYDIKTLKGQILKFKLDYGGNIIKSIDTCANARRFIAKTEVENYKLDTIAQYFGIKFTEEQHHDAFFDTIACMRIFNRLVDLSDGNLKVTETKIHE